ncbi:TetR/AcrR family transcriptional regulator [Paracoccus aestuariivivens]|uniref:TetR family transcriptional regulator n=1 Tax=Paracoccus aestuariivivens TaxID=1820333 RepID=A0A6L6JE87_9RHOB|nr:TetR/AcrR family transcriptional regulator [Paracoccus aestuariivivens]MTH79059.1 TetR family transcriptional regulator [Paracoccus aestuariivivens]
MKTSDEQDSGWRGSPELWLDAAYEMLVEGGIDAVKIQPLASRLRLSRTSFYWFFKDRDALLDVLARMWVQRTTAPLVAATQAYAATRSEAMLNVLACFLSDAFDSRLEFAVRGWSLRDAAMRERLQVADAERLMALAQLLVHWGHDPDEADVRARTIYLVQIGYISMQTRESLQTRLERIPNYVEIYTGTRPTEAELARFRAGLEGLA